MTNNKNDRRTGRTTLYSDQYDAGLIETIARAEGRESLELGPELPFSGHDLWNAYELSWLDDGGRPVVATLSVSVPCESPRLIESKSMKLYLASFAMSRFDSPRVVRSRIVRDLEQAAGLPVEVNLTTAARKSTGRIRRLPGRCIDYEDIAQPVYEVDASLLKSGGDTVTETLHSHVLRSLCPVTGQPDTGSLLVTYDGPRIDEGALLAYLISYRQHADFHELCVERIFRDIREHCGASSLTVYARYNRRGGIDINPFRSNFEDVAPPLRLWRQ
ncbi:MAG: NADPH-dependent 7-cyano-7-deazaguanine reductase QueF [Woeseiaceae bacterium]|nr:NADPH-dependent 7-cyano-7-deazaguanine reductase QueF [Woeseiaceae bacterium]